MRFKKFSMLLVALTVMSPLIVACQAEPETVETIVTRVVTEVEEREVPVEVTRIVTEVETQTETVIEEVEKAPLGSEERPIQVFFVPSVEADVIITGGDLMAQELEKATGYKYVVNVPTSYAATIEAMCASPDDSMGFIPALGYVLANDRCGITASLAAVRFGWPYYWAQIVVRNDSGIESIEDLDGLRWGSPSLTSTSGWMVPAAVFQDMGIEPSETVETGGHTGAMLAVANGDVDFATGFFSPPLMPERTWNPATDDPEIWRDGGSPEYVDGRVFVAGGPSEGGYRVLDARAAAMETYPAIFEETEIIWISDEIPNDTVSFGPDFPLGLADEIAAAVKAYAESDACNEPPEGVVTLCSDAFYNWTGAAFARDSDFDPVRFIITSLGMSEEEILGG